MCGGREEEILENSGSIAEVDRYELYKKTKSSEKNEYEDAVRAVEVPSVTRIPVRIRETEITALEIHTYQREQSRENVKREKRSSPVTPVCTLRCALGTALAILPISLGFLYRSQSAERMMRFSLNLSRRMRGK